MNFTNRKTNLKISMIILLLIGISVSSYSLNPDTLQADYTVTQCDSLIKANANNPNLVLLDVRRPTEHIPQHLIGAINIDYFAENFEDLINSLPRHKLYVVYCLSGGRSGMTLDLMVDMNFTNVVNMLGGITEWKNNSFPTTPAFAALNMNVSDSIVPMDTIKIGYVDTIELTVTNRANDTLRFNSITNLTGSEFSTDFDTATILLGAEDYTFSIFYEPVDEESDSLSFIIESNGGDVAFYIWRTGIDAVFQREIVKESEFKIYPNPVTSSTIIDYELEKAGFMQLSVYNQLGKQVALISEEYQTKGKHKIIWNTENLPVGIYYLAVKTDWGIQTTKMIKSE